MYIYFAIQYILPAYVA